MDRNLSIAHIDLPDHIFNCGNKNFPFHFIFDDPDVITGQLNHFLQLTEQAALFRINKASDEVMNKIFAGGWFE